jgi:hypothetical protein
VQRTVTNDVDRAIIQNDEELEDEAQKEGRIALRLHSRLPLEIQRWLSLN